MSNLQATCNSISIVLLALAVVLCSTEIKRLKNQINNQEIQIEKQVEQR